MTEVDALRLLHLEAAFLDLLNRTKSLESQLQFEVSQRRAIEEMVVKLAMLPGRVDQLERENRRRSKTGGRAA
jgi:hypothetical protein